MPIAAIDPTATHGKRAPREGSLRSKMLKELADTPVGTRFTARLFAEAVQKPMGKTDEQHRAEVGSVLTTDLKTEGALSHYCRRVAPGVFERVEPAVE